MRRSSRLGSDISSHIIRKYDAIMGVHIMHLSVMPKEQAIELGYSSDKRKRRREHRAASKRLLEEGGIFNGFCAVGSSFWCIAQWHSFNARRL